MTFKGGTFEMVRKMRQGDRKFARQSTILASDERSVMTRFFIGFILLRVQREN